MDKYSLNSACHQLISLIRHITCDDMLLHDSLCWDEILELAKKNRIESIIYLSLKDKADVPENVKAKLRAAWLNEIVQDVRQSEVAAKIRECLKKEGIIFAEMKGLILKNDYPSTNLRYMSDLDFYVRSSDRERIHDCMVRMGAEEADSDSGDVSYNLPNRVHVEFHGRLLYRSTKEGVIGYSDWDCVREEKCCLTEEGYALNLIGHVIYNLAHAGCGLRYILDLWIYRHRHSPQPDWNEVINRLKLDGLDEVAKNILDLSEWWFGDGQRTILLDELGQYILGSGLYGVYSRETLSNAALCGGKVAAIKSQVFRSREEFENRYPWLRKYPFLFPVAWVMRVIKSLRTNREIIGRWTKQLRQSDQKAVLEHKARLKRFGF